MLVNLHLDYRNEEFLREAFAKFGKMRGWIRDDPESARTLVCCAYAGTADIPRSLVIIEPQRYGGTIVSWTVPVYILISEPADLVPGDESPPPENGNPHPQNFVGPIPPAGNWVPPTDNAWNEWDEENAAENEPNPAWEQQPQAQVLNQHPAQVQSTISFQLSDISTSSVRFVPGLGPTQEIVVQPPHFAAHDMVLIEDIEENDEYFALAPENNAVYELDMNGYHPLAIVPYAPPANPLLALLAKVPIQVNIPTNIAVKEKVTM
jgi:hypothetical protein